MEHSELEEQLRESNEKKAELTDMLNQVTGKLSETNVVNEVRRSNFLINELLIFFINKLFNSI